MKVSVPIELNGKKMADNLILDIDAVIVEVKKNPPRITSVRDLSQRGSAGEIRIIYDVYLNKKRIRTDMDILRTYNNAKDLSEALKGFRGLMHKSLLSCDMGIDEIVNGISEKWVFFSDTEKDIIAKIIAGNKSK